MVEADFGEYYKGKSPIELNRELEMLIEQLPEGPLVALVANLDEMMHIAQARKNSSERQIFEARRRALIPLATVTPSFAEFITDTLTISYGFGVEKPASIAWMVDQDGPGIFDPSTSKEFERRGYKLESINALKVYASLGNLVSEFDLPGDVTDNFAEVLNNPAILDRTKHVRKWRQEFIDKYNEEP